METWRIEWRDGRAEAVVRLGPSGEELDRSERPWTVRELCRRSGKSRRQIYRDISSGKLHPLGRFLGAWLIPRSAPAQLRPPPATLASLFPDHDPARLDLEGSREEVLARVLTTGGSERLRWVFAFYGPEAVRSFVARQGPRSLDERSLGFWQLFFRLRRARVHPDRAKGRRWGGA